MLNTPYELRIPAGSLVSTETAGVLGETFVGIDVSTASGPPVRNGAELPSRQTKRLTTEEWLELVKGIVHKGPCGGEPSHDEPSRKP